MRFTPLLLIVGGNVLYHLGQKTMPQAVPAVTATLCAYVIAALACLALLPLCEPGWTLASARTALHPSPLLVGLGIVGVELGFLLAYRSGWPISSASLVAMSVLALVLLPIGVIAFRETWTLQRSLGLLLCLAGLWFLKPR